MTAVNLKTLLTKANRNNYSVAGLVVISWEDAIAYTEAAHETKIPIILQAGPSCRQFTPVSILGKMEKVNCSRLEENQTSLGRLLISNIVTRISYINYEI